MFFILLFYIPLVYVLSDFVYLLASKKPINYHFFDIVFDIALVAIYPIILFFIGGSGPNECCVEMPAYFSPSHLFTIIVLTVLSQICYFYSSWYKHELLSPILEVIVNVFLLIGIVINVVLLFHVEFYLAMMACVPIILLFIKRLHLNHKMFIEEYNETYNSQKFFIQKYAWLILSSRPIVKFPALFLLCFPVIVILSSILLLFGQKPDSAIRAFTDTYKHGLSQLDHLCENVECGGHFLCSVAANGHSTLVKPIRYGARNGGKIICNRQLLISNAFEELIEQKLPKAHRFIRRNYNKVGNVIHRYYSIFNNKFVSDTLYILMKPLEWFFLLTLYTFDKKPESRIAQQYMHKIDREALKNTHQN